MSSWKQAVQAQLLFAQKMLSEAQDLEASGAPLLGVRMYQNGAILSARELWACWLNEWVGLLAPKAKKARVLSLQDFEQTFAGSPSLDQLKAELKQPDSWVKGFIELERLNAIDWADSASMADKKTNDENAVVYDGLSIVQLDIRPCSVSNGLNDISRMLTELKLFIEHVREQHSEW